LFVNLLPIFDLLFILPSLFLPFYPTGMVQALSYDRCAVRPLSSTLPTVALGLGFVGQFSPFSPQMVSPPGHTCRNSSIRRRRANPPERPNCRPLVRLAQAIEPNSEVQENGRFRSIWPLGAAANTFTPVIG
jgi:hypothetical protein